MFPNFKSKKLFDSDGSLLFEEATLTGFAMKALPINSVPVTIIASQLKSSGLLLHIPSLDSSTTRSVIGCKSSILGKRIGDSILIRLVCRRLIPATITHIHVHHDTFRAEITTSRLTEEEKNNIRMLAPPPEPKVNDELKILDPVS